MPFPPSASKLDTGGSLSAIPSPAGGPSVNEKPTAESDVHVLTVCQMIVAAVLLGAALYWLRPVLVPFILALFLVCGVAPVLDLIQQRLGAPRIVAVAVAFLGGLALLACLWLFVYLSVATMLNDAGIYRQRYQAIVQRVASMMPFDKETTENLEADLEAASDPDSATSPDLAEFTGNYVQMGLSHLATALTDFLASATMVLIFMFFLLLGGSSKTESQSRSQIWTEIESKIRNYIVTKTVISLVTGGESSA